jgi:hypothetical protein
MWIRFQIRIELSYKFRIGTETQYGYQTLILKQDCKIRNIYDYKSEWEKERNNCFPF